MIAFDSIFLIIGIFLSSLALSMIAPGAVDFFCHDINWVAFALAGFLTLFIGLLLICINIPDKQFKLSVRDTFILTTLSWFAIAIFSALPFIFSNSTDSYTDSFFEAISGLTTTGATILQGIDYASRGIILWRAILQWLGGIGIVVMALTVMPVLKVGGMQLFRNEFSDRSEKIHPKLSQITRYIFLIYIFFTTLCIALLKIAGMTGFDAVCYGLVTVSTGGFSTASESINAYNSLTIETIIMAFMIFGAITLLLFVRMLQGNWKAFFQDSQLRCFLKIIVSATLIISAWRYLHGASFFDSLHETTFTVISIITTTGFTTYDYHLWGNFCLIVLMIILQIGGCTGSTSGSIKVFRFQIMFAIARSHLVQMRHPHGIFIPRYQGQRISETVFASVFTFFVLYAVSLGIISLGLAYYHLDLVSCIFGAASALNNTGCALGPIFGPQGTYLYLPDGAKWWLILGMVLGRLEYVTLIILLSRRFWRH